MIIKVHNLKKTDIFDKASLKYFVEYILRVIVYYVLNSRKFEFEKH